RRVAVAAIAAGLVATLAGPLAYVVDTVAGTQSGAIVSAGPSVAAAASFGPPVGGSAPGGFLQPPGRGGSFGPQQADSAALVSYLLAHRGSATWIAAEVGSNSAAGLELASGQPVMSMGGFSGGAAAPTRSQFEALVSEGKVRYLVVQSGGGGGGANMRSGGQVAQVVSWAEAHGKQVTISGVSGVTV